MKKIRLSSLDFIKTFSIFLVCFYHANTLNLDYLSSQSFIVYFKNFVVSFASMGVPLFFMVNGALILNSKFIFKKHLSKTFKIIFITISWIFITLILTSIICNIPYNNIYSLLKDFWFWPSGTLNHFWFLFSIIHIYLLYPLIKSFFSDYKVLYFSLIVIFIFTFGNTFLVSVIHFIEYFCSKSIINNTEFNIFHNFNFLYETKFYSVFYFIIGGLILNKKDLIITKIKKNTLIPITLFSCVLLFSYTIIVSRLYGYRYDPVWNGYDNIFTLFMSLSIFIFCIINEKNFLPSQKILSLIGTNTFGIYIVHMLIIFKFKPIFSNTVFSNNLFANILFGIFIMVSSLIITLLMKKIPIINKLIEF